MPFIAFESARHAQKSLGVRSAGSFQDRNLGDIVNIFEESSRFCAPKIFHPEGLSVL